jgi:hypothetical protein
VCRLAPSTFRVPRLGEGELPLASAAIRPRNASGVLLTSGSELRMKPAHRLRRPLGQCRPSPAARADDEPVGHRKTPQVSRTYRARLGNLLPPFTLVADSVSLSIGGSQHTALARPLPSTGLMEPSQDTRRADSDDSPGSDSARIAAILAELNPGTDLASLVERVCRNDFPWIVVPALSLAAWEQRDPSGWAKVLTWLETKGVTIVRI